MRAVLAHCHNCGSLPNWEADIQTSPLHAVIDKDTNKSNSNTVKYIASH
jgi:hypothetical protein